MPLIAALAGAILLAPKCNISRIDERRSPCVQAFFPITDKTTLSSINGVRCHYKFQLWKQTPLFVQYACFRVPTIQSKSRTTAASAARYNPFDDLPRSAFVLVISLVSSTSGAAADAANYDRLVEATKLWASIKYRPRVHGRCRFRCCGCNVTPKILAAKNDGEFSAAIDEMLAALHDPLTRVLQPGTGMFGKTKAKPVIADQDGLTLVRMEDGAFQDARRAGAEVARMIAGKGPVVFDLRGNPRARVLSCPRWLWRGGQSGHQRITRAHSGYANEANLGSGGYASTGNCTTA